MCKCPLHFVILCFGTRRNKTRLNTVSLKVVLLSNQYLEQIKSGSHHIFRQQSLENNLVLPPVCIFYFAFKKKSNLLSGRNTGLELGA